MGNFSSNQLIKNQDLSVPLAEKETKLEDDPQHIVDAQQSQKTPQREENSEIKESTKKEKKQKIDDITLNQKDLLPEQFSSLEKLQKGYLEDKEKKKKSFIESSEWELNIFEIEEITCLSVTSDSKFLISATQAGLMTVFNLETKKPVHHFRIRDIIDKIVSIAVSEDNEYVFAAAEWGIRLFNLITKEEVLYKRAEEISSAIISKDKNHVVTGGLEGSIKIFSVLTKEEIYCMANIHQGPIHSMAFSNDNRYLVCGSGDGSVKIFDFNTRNQIHSFATAHKGAIYSVTISHDDNYIITGSADHSIKVFSLKTKEELYHFIEAHEDEITSVVVSKDNKHIYSASKDLSIKVFDLETKQEISRFKEIHKSLEFAFSSFTLVLVQITSIVLSNDQRYLFSGSLDGSIMMFDFKSQQKIYLEDDSQKDRIKDLAISDDNRYIITASDDRYIKFSQGIYNLKILSKNKFLMVDCINKIRLFDLVSMKQTNEMKKNKDIDSPYISRDESFLLFCIENSIKILDVLTFQEVREVPCNFWIDRIDLSNDMKYLAFDGLEKCEVIDFETNNKIMHVDCCN